MNPSIPTPEAPTGSRRRPRKIDRDTSCASRPESIGGVPLPQDNATEAGARNNVTAEKSEHAPSRRRRPKKLNSASDKSTSVPSSGLVASNSVRIEPTVTPEIEALKTRVEGIESQLRELLQRAPPKLSRRRQRQRKPGEPEARDEPPEELVRLEDELRSARRELEHLRRRSSSRSDQASAIADEEDEVEEIPRTSAPTVAPIVPSGPVSRAVTFSGSYRLPIPFSASEAELQSIQAGIASAQRLACKFLEANPLYDSVSTERAFVSRNTVTRSGETWSEWYGGYNMSVSRPAKTIAASNVSKSTPTTLSQLSTQPPKLRSNLRRAITGVPARKAPPKLEIRSGNAGRAGIAPSSIRRTASVPASSFSHSQMAGLLS